MREASQRLKSALVALSLANLCLIRIWVGLLGTGTSTGTGGTPPKEWFAAALLNLALLAALFWIARRWPTAVAFAAGALIAKELVLVLAGGGQRWQGQVATLVETGLRQAWLIPLGILLLAAAGWTVSWIRERKQLAWLPSFLLALSPIVPVTAGQAAWHLLAPLPLAAKQPPAKPSAMAHEFAPHPFVWIVFDELDERVAFSQRPTGVNMPELDRFRNEAIVFRQAFSPANATSISIPTLLGKLLERPHLRAGVVGWYLPYCRDYALARCQAWPMNRQVNSYGPGLRGGLGRVVANQLRSLFETSLYSVFGQSLAVQAHVRTVEEMEEAAVRLVADPYLDLVFIHLPAPHPPFVGPHLTAANQDARGYLVNLALADRIFGKIRAGLTATGRWHHAHVLVTGDHGYRQAQKLGYPPEDRHVPWMWKPAGTVPPRQSSQPFETSRTAELIARLLEGDTPQSVLARYP